MRAFSRGKYSLLGQPGASGCFASSHATYGSARAYRRPAALNNISVLHQRYSQQRIIQTLLTATSTHAQYRTHTPLSPSANLQQLRSLHTQSKEQPDIPKAEPQSTSKAEGAADSAKSAADDARSKADAEGAEQDQSKQKEDQKEDEKDKRKEEAPPKPPHGDKSPWQVFTDTLRTEFKASKEWNESTKAIASSAHDFTQNETLKRARGAYGAAAGVATTSTAKALKATGKVIGQSAAWTWDTTPVKGIRAGASATGRGIEKATRPVRETETFKSMRDVIDDGSSSRYGGWVEKDERKRLREIREIREAARTGRPIRRAEKMEEDIE